MAILDYQIETVLMSTGGQNGPTMFGKRVMTLLFFAASAEGNFPTSRDERAPVHCLPSQATLGVLWQIPALDIFSAVLHAGEV